MACVIGSRWIRVGNEERTNEFSFYLLLLLFQLYVRLLVTMIRLDEIYLFWKIDKVLRKFECDIKFKFFFVLCIFFNMKYFLIR